MRPLGIERLCVFGMPPVEFVGLAADLDCRFVGVALTAMRYYNPHAYPDWSLRDDPALRREMRAAMADRNVGVSLCEGFGVGRDIDVASYAADLDLVRELGCRRVNVVSMDKDFARTADGFGFDNLYFDISATVLVVADSPVEEEFLWTLRNVGLDHVLLGSDYPQIGLDATVEAFERLDLTDEEKAKIRSGNAMKLFGR